VSSQTSPPPIGASKRVVRAAWIAPMEAGTSPASPVLRDAAVVFCAGRIVDLGGADAITAAHPDAHVTDLGAAILLPGLVNPHTHLELSYLTPRPAPGSFVDWVKRVIADIESQGGNAAFAAGGFAHGLSQALQYGVTSIGDIGGRSVRVLRQALAGVDSIRLTSYGEVTAMAQRRGHLEERLKIATDPSDTGPRIRIGLSPHSPYSIEPEGYRRCLAAARYHGLPLATHLAETPDEAEFLATHTGPFRELWESLGAWDDQVPTFAGGPIRYARSLGLMDYPTLLAHVNYCNDDELAIVAGGRASVVYCPRTHRYFGHPPHRWREMLAHGINVAVGTDSTASSPNLNIVDDLRLIHEIAPEHAVEDLWRMATIRAAAAIDSAGVVGSIQRGKHADFVAFAVHGDDPLREVLEKDARPIDVWIGGVPITPAAVPDQHTQA
jgi:cytosine/adenosine deaminase-related metal-dependent hydrolase